MLSNSFWLSYRLVDPDDCSPTQWWGSGFPHFPTSATVLSFREINTNTNTSSLVSCFQCRKLSPYVGDGWFRISLPRPSFYGTRVAREKEEVWYEDEQSRRMTGSGPKGYIGRHLQSGTLRLVSSFPTCYLGLPVSLYTYYQENFF